MEILNVQMILILMGMLAFLGAAVILVMRPTKEYRSNFLKFGIAGILSIISGLATPYIDKWASANITTAAITVGAIWIVLVVWGVVSIVSEMLSEKNQ